MAAHPPRPARRVTMSAVSGARGSAVRLPSALAAVLAVFASMLFVPAARAAAGSTTRASVAMDGGFVNSEAKEPAISASGRYVAYTSAASNVVPGDVNGIDDVFAYDRVTGATTLVSQSTSGEIGNGASSQPSISPDGRYVAFVSYATNFQPESNPVGGQGSVINARDIFLRDLQAGTTVRITAGGGNPGSIGSSFDPSVSANADFVAFTSLDKAIAGFGDCNSAHDVMVWERATGVARMVSTGTTQSVCGTPESEGGAGAYAGMFQGDRQSQNPVISADGSVIAFSSDASNLSAGQAGKDQTYYP